MISRAFLAFNAIAIGSIGLFYLIDPNILLGRYDLQAGSVGMDNMLRSAYGGVFLISAGVFALGVFQSSRLRDSLIFLAMFMAGAALGRGVSVFAAGPPPDAILPLLYFEIIVCTVALTMTRFTSKPTV